MEYLYFTVRDLPIIGMHHTQAIFGMLEQAVLISSNGGGFEFFFWTSCSWGKEIRQKKEKNSDKLGQAYHYYY